MANRTFARGRAGRPARPAGAVVGVALACALGLAGFAPTAAAERAAAPSPAPDERRTMPATDCEAPVGYPLNTTMSGYVITERTGGRTCVPIREIPRVVNGPGEDERIERATFAAATEALEACRAAEDPCPADIAAAGYAPSTFRKTGTLDAVGLIDPYDPHVDLAQIRRPAYFAQDPYDEPIADAESRTWTVDLAVPVDPYDRLSLGLTGRTHLRGWYLKGHGVPLRDGGRSRALVILIGGRTVETTATDDPRDPTYVLNDSGQYVYNTGAHGESLGAHVWRGYLDALHRAGFDVLTFDKRGHGISGGRTPDNVLNQGLDMLRARDALRTGDGLRVLGPHGAERSGRAAARSLLSPRQARTMPTLLGGSSQGAVATEWAMWAATSRWCRYDEPGAPCFRPWREPTIEGAMLLSAIWSLPAYGDPSRLTTIAAMATENHVARYLPSEPLDSVGRWPAMLTVKGLWDDQPDGTYSVFDAHLRAGDRSQLFYVRGPHSEVQWGQPIIERVQRRMVAFASRAVRGRPITQQRYRDLQDAVEASWNVYEPSTPRTAVGRSR